jgi:hypothetical protein
LKGIYDGYRIDGAGASGYVAWAGGRFRYAYHILRGHAFDARNRAQGEAQGRGGGRVIYADYALYAHNLAKNESFCRL